jgi:hypothetical protein
VPALPFFQSPEIHGHKWWLSSLSRLVLPDVIRWPSIVRQEQSSRDDEEHEGKLEPDSTVNSKPSEMNSPGNPIAHKATYERNTSNKPEL